MGIFDDSSFSNPLQSPFATAQYRPTPSGTFPNAPAPGPLPIPPAQPPIFLSPPDPAAAPAPPASPWDSLANGINNHALTLMALGAGIAQGGVGRGLAAAATAAEGERNRQAQQFNFLQTYKALTDGGVPRAGGASRHRQPEPDAGAGREISRAEVARQCYRARRAHRRAPPQSIRPRRPPSPGILGRIPRAMH